jgi:AcrR family transcriptional regulator
MQYCIVVAASTRNRMLLSTALLMRERGARATSIDDVLAHSGAPRGSVYHHFPGGREQLLREATELAADYVVAQIERGDDPVAVLDALVEQLHPGCPVVAVAVEDGTEAQAAAGVAFRRWQEALERLGVPRDRALLAVAAIEGAIVMSRAQKDPAPLESVRAQLRELLKGPA